MKNYEIEARSRWGNTDACREHEKKTKNYSKEKWAEINDGLMAIFAESNTAENMKAYLENAYNEEKLYGELCNPDSSFFFIYADERLAGYLKINEFPSQTDINDIDSLELERIYILKEFQGAGLGKDLLEHTISIAIEHGKKYIWLGVWEHNERAKHFYQKNGFYRIGEHSFVVGDDVQIDFVMRKDL